MIGRMIVRGAIRSAARNSAQNTGKPKELDAGGKAVAGTITVAILAGLITEAHAWVPALCILGSLTFVSAIVVACAMGSQRQSRDRQAQNLDAAMAAYGQPSKGRATIPVPSVPLTPAKRKPGLLEKTLTLILAAFLIFMLCLAMRAVNNHTDQEYGTPYRGMAHVTMHYQTGSAR